MRTSPPSSPPYALSYLDGSGGGVVIAVRVRDPGRAAAEPFADQRGAGRAQADALDTPADQKVDLARLDEWLAQGGNPQEEMSNAVLSGDLVRVDYLLKKGAKLDGLDGQGLGALHHAAKDRKVAVVRELLARKANANLKDSDGWPVLAHAVLRDDPDAAAGGRGHALLAAS